MRMAIFWHEALEFWGNQQTSSSFPSLSTFLCLSLTCRDSSFSPSSLLCFIYSLWFTWDWWSSPLIVVITPVLLLQCIMHNRLTKHRRGKARLIFIGLLMHAGRRLPGASSRTRDNGWLVLGVFSTAGWRLMCQDGDETDILWWLLVPSVKTDADEVPCFNILKRDLPCCHVSNWRWLLVLSDTSKASDLTVSWNTDCSCRVN